MSIEILSIPTIHGRRRRGCRVRGRRIDRDAIAGRDGRNVGRDRLGGGDIGVAFLQFRRAARVERVRVLGVAGERDVVVGDGGIEGAELELDEAAAVERVICTSIARPLRRRT